MIEGRSRPEMEACQAQADTEEIAVVGMGLAVLGGRTPTVEDLSRLPYLRMVVNEALRVYPCLQGVAFLRAVGDCEPCER